MLSVDPGKRGWELRNELKTSESSWEGKRDVAKVVDVLREYYLKEKQKEKTIELF